MLDSNPIEYSMFLIFTGAALLATLALYARQAMIVAYILLGILLGPWGFSMISDPEQIKDISHIGIIFLLFLLGLDLLPQQLWEMLGEALIITLLSSVIFCVFGIFTGLAFGYPFIDTIVIGVIMMFSSTIIGLKLLPTTTLHHKHTGQIIISVLLIQDLLAIIILLLLQGYGQGNNIAIDIAYQLVTLPLLILIAYLFDRFVLLKLLEKFDQIHEYVFLLALGWCMGMAQLAVSFGLSHEIGAFVAGITLASSPIALFITERLKPLRDFFLIIFFFSIGASFNIDSLEGIIFPAVILGALIIFCKPLVFLWLLKSAGEKTGISMEVGYRLGQGSEFSLLIAVLALESSFIAESTFNLIQLTMLMTFIISSYIIVMYYPTPIGVTEKLRRD